LTFCNRSRGKRATHFWKCRSFTDSPESGLLTTAPCPKVRRTWFASNPVNAYDLLVLARPTTRKNWVVTNKIYHLLWSGYISNVAASLWCRKSECNSQRQQRGQI